MTVNRVIAWANGVGMQCLCGIIDVCVFPADTVSVGVLSVSWPIASFHCVSPCQCVCAFGVPDL